MVAGVGADGNRRHGNEATSAHRNHLDSTVTGLAAPFPRGRLQATLSTTSRIGPGMCLDAKEGAHWTSTATIFVSRNCLCPSLYLWTQPKPHSWPRLLHAFHHIVLPRPHLFLPSLTNLPSYSVSKQCTVIAARVNNHRVFALPLLSFPPHSPSPVNQHLTLAITNHSQDSIRIAYYDFHNALLRLHRRRSRACRLCCRPVCRRVSHRVPFERSGWSDVHHQVHGH